MSDPSSFGLQTSHDTAVPTTNEFVEERSVWRLQLAERSALRLQAVALQQAADECRYTYTWDWLGVPIIRLPDDVMVLQEIFWTNRPERVIETGVARGGSMLLNASLMQLCGVEPMVLGIDIKIFPHTRDAIGGHAMAKGVELLEAGSTTELARETARRFLGDGKRAILVLDSNHTHDHVLSELRILAPLLPIGSLVLVADTLVEEFPAGYYNDRPWDKGDNPMTAVRAFLSENRHFELAADWSRRALVTEFRDGILRKVS